MEVDYSREFGPSDKEKWDTEYQANVTIDNWMSGLVNDKNAASSIDSDSLALPYDFLDDFEDMSPAERQYVLDELACQPQLWDREEVMYL